METRDFTLASVATTGAGSPADVVERKNMSYTYAWFYLPKLPVRLA